MKNRKELEIKTTALLKKYNSNKDIYNNMIKELKNKMTFNKFSDIYDGRLPTKFLSDIDLYLISNTLYTSLDKFKIESSNVLEEINPSSYFTEIEINQGENIFIKETESKEYLTIPNVKQVEDGIFISYKVSAQFIAKSFNDGFSLYNPATQRAGEKMNVYGEEVIVPKIFDESVKGISEEVKENRYLPTLLTWNIIPHEKEEAYKYNPKTEELTIKKSNIVDGQNRTIGILKAILQNPNTDCFFYLQFYVNDILKSQRFIVQESKHHPVDLETIEFMTPNKYMDIAKDINGYGSEEINMMFNKIEKTEKETLILNKYTTFEVLSTSIEDCFKNELKIPRDNIKIREFLVEFFNEFLGINYNYLQNIEKTREETVLLDTNMFSGYVYMASKLYNTDEWRKKLESICNNIDWNKSDEWNGLKYWGESTPSVRKRLYNYFDKIIN